MPRIFIAVLSLIVLTACGSSADNSAASSSSSTASGETPISASNRSQRGEPIPDQYIVLLDKQQQTSSGAVIPLPTAVNGLLVNHGGVLLHTYSDTLRGFVAKLTPAQADALANDPAVLLVEQDRIIQIAATQTNATWGLDRSDQQNLPLNATYSYSVDGSSVHTYIIDTGIRLSHSEFNGRTGASRNFVGTTGLFSTGSADPNDFADCNGHGTHVAGTVAGSKYGIAKSATVHAVRVLDCQGSGSTSGVINGVDWVAQNHIKPAVANMSLGGGASSALDTAVRNAVAAGVTMVVAAGNDNSNACNASPAREASAVTVGSTTKQDGRSSFSNHGVCVDVFAPGSSITSAWYQNDNQTNTISGTSMAAPHVAGAAALLLGAQPQLTPNDVTDALLNEAVAGRLSGMTAGSPNLLMQITQASAPPPPPVDAAPTAAYTVACTNLACQFNASSSSDDNGALTYAWNFGDNTSGSGLSLGHSYGASGSYSVALTVTDSANQTDTVTQIVTVTAASSGCNGCQQHSGNLSGNGDIDYYSSSNGFSSNGGQFSGQLSGPGNADFDLYLDKLTTTFFFSSWQAVASSESVSSEESINYNGSAGTYRWRVKSYSGNGDYTVYLQNP